MAPAAFPGSGEERRGVGAVSGGQGRGRGGGSREPLRRASGLPAGRQHCKEGRRLGRRRERGAGEAGGRGREEGGREILEGRALLGEHPAGAGIPGSRERVLFLFRLLSGRKRAQSVLI